MPTAVTHGLGFPCDPLADVGLWAVRSPLCGAHQADPCPPALPAGSRPRLQRPAPGRAAGPGPGLRSGGRTSHRDRDSLVPETRSRPRPEGTACEGAATWLAGLRGTEGGCSLFLLPLDGRPPPCLTGAAMRVQPQRREVVLAWGLGPSCPARWPVSMLLPESPGSLPVPKPVGLGCPGSQEPETQRGLEGHPDTGSPRGTVWPPGLRAGQPWSFVLAPLLTGPSLQPGSWPPGKGWAESRPVSHAGEGRGRG